MNNSKPQGGTTASDGDVVVLVLLAVLALPAVISVLVPAARAWLLKHHVLVTTHESLVSIPGTAAGLDGRRIVIALLGLVAAVALGTWLQSSSRRDRS